MANGNAKGNGQWRFQDEPLAAKSSGFAFIPVLFVVNVCLSWLVRLQYGQDVTAKLVLGDSWQSIPLFAVIFWLVHPYLASRVGQATVAVAAFALCGYIIHLANEMGYYAVMYQAPPLGTLAVWAFIELNFTWSMVVLAALGVFLWKGEYSL